MQFINNIFDFFVPRFCPACEKKLGVDEAPICTNCISEFKMTNENYLNLEYEKKFEADKIIAGFHAQFMYEAEFGLQSIIHSLKYRQKFLLGVFLGKLIAANAREKLLKWDCDLIVPVPLHSVKKAERGYNQSYYIAKGLSDFIDLPVKTNVIKRIKKTKTQTLLNAEERRENVQNAFKIRKRKLVKGKRIILVDDLITTGATIKECAKILNENGAISVFAVSVATPI